MTPTAAARTTASTRRSRSAAPFRATLSLSLGAPASFGTGFTPGVARDYTATTSANVISTAGDATLSVTDPSTQRSGPPGQRRVQPPDGAEGRRHQPGEHVGRRRHGQRHAADPDHLVRPGLQRSGAGPVHAVDRCQRRAAHRHLREDADLHAQHHDAVGRHARAAVDVLNGGAQASAGSSVSSSR